jgi:hypothetical protein
MKRLLAILLCLFPTLLRAEEIALNQHYCVITLPEGQTWNRNAPLRLPDGEIIFDADRFDTQQQFYVAVLPNNPSADIGNPGSIARVLATLRVLGYTVTEPKPIQWKERNFVEFFGTRKRGTFDDVVVARATVKDKTIYILATAGRGSEERAADPKFTAILEGFQFSQGSAFLPPASASPLFPLYRIATWSCAAAAGMLVVFFGIVLLTTRRRAW